MLRRVRASVTGCKQPGPSENRAWTGHTEQRAYRYAAEHPHMDANDPTRMLDSRTIDGNRCGC